MIVVKRPDQKERDVPDQINCKSKNKILRSTIIFIDEQILLKN